MTRSNPLVRQSDLAAYCDRAGRKLTICQPGEHDWSTGDEDAVYCSNCTGYLCPSCNGAGRVPNGLATKRCHGCSGLEVQMFWEPEFRLINPHNWLAAAREAHGRA